MTAPAHRAAPSPPQVCEPADSPANLPTRDYADDGVGDGVGLVPQIALAPGAVVDGTRYRLVAWLGDGGMGVVYEAEHLDLGRRVALKVLRSEACRRPDRLAMFRAEARALASIRSPFIVELYDFAELGDGRAMFAMELLRGRTLRSALAHGPIELSHAIAVLRQICKGLTAAHAAGILHRDVKPENIFLTTVDGRPDCVRLLDFGVSAIMSEHGRVRGRVAGTPWYFAPELVSGLPHDGRADLYALGCTAFEILVGRRPFEGNEGEVLLAHIGREPPRFAEVAAVPPQLAAIEAVVQRCLAKRPEDRFASAVELEAALCEVQIACGLTTAHDDLALPEVEPRRRARLREAMPHADDHARAHRRRVRGWWRLGGALAGMVMAGTILHTWPSEAARADVETLVEAARHAAAQAYFVYPPPDDPDHATAYDHVLRLEAIGGLAGVEASHRARELRSEFTGTLVRLGDRYWGLEGGAAFAIDYYACALVFDPDHAHARERASLTIGEVVALRDKARDHAFTRDELAAASPLLALAEDDERLRTERLAALAPLVAERSASTRVALDRLSQRDDPPTRARPVARGSTPAGLALPSKSPELAAPAVDTATLPLAPIVAGDPATATAAPTAGDAATVRARVREGRVALTSGEPATASRRFEAALALDADDADAHAGLAEAEFELGHASSAMRHARLAARRRPNDAALRVLWGDACFKAYRYADALTQYQRALELGHAAAAARVAKVRAKLIE